VVCENLKTALTREFNIHIEGFLTTPKKERRHGRKADKAKHELTTLQAKSDVRIGRLLYQLRAMVGRRKNCCIKYKQQARGPKDDG